MKAQTVIVSGIAAVTVWGSLVVSTLAGEGDEASGAADLGALGGTNCLVVYTNNPVLRPGATGEWDAGALGSMTLLKVGELYHLGNVEDAHVVHDKTGSRYLMYNWDRKHEPMGLFRAQSPNETGFDFAHAERIRIEGLRYPAMYKFTHVFQEGGRWHMLFGEFERPGCKGCWSGYATSSDGVRWEAQNRRLLLGQDAEVLKAGDDLYFMYYGPNGYFDQQGCDIRLANCGGRLSALAGKAGN